MYIHRIWLLLGPDTTSLHFKGILRSTHTHTQIIWKRRDIRISVSIRRHSQECYVTERSGEIVSLSGWRILFVTNKIRMKKSPGEGRRIWETKCTKSLEMTPLKKRGWMTKDSQTYDRETSTHNFYIRGEKFERE